MNEDVIMSPEEAARYLKVNPHTIYRNLRCGRLPGGKVGRQWRIRKSDIDRFLAGGLFLGNEKPDKQAAWKGGPVNEPS